MTTGIYCLVAADGREYVGSSVRVEGRIRSHLCDVKIRSLIDKGILIDHSLA